MPYKINKSKKKFERRSKSYCLLYTKRVYRHNYMLHHNNTNSKLVQVFRIHNRIHTRNATEIR